jgi:hypothetical protein
MFKHKAIDYVRWFIYGILSWIMSRLDDIDIWPINLINFLSVAWVGRNPPAWWIDYYTWNTWYHNVDSEGRPSKWLADVRTFTGYVKSGYANFAKWIEGIDNRIGAIVPLAVSTFAEAIVKVYKFLPLTIRLGVAWTDWLNAQITVPVQTWVKGRVDAAIAKITTVWQWFNLKRIAIEAWYNDTASFVRNLANNPYLAILGYLGVLSSVWFPFWDNPVEWILKGIGVIKADVYNFFNSPVDWFLDKLQNAVANLAIGYAYQVAEIMRIVLLRVW